MNGDTATLDRALPARVREALRGLPGDVHYVLKVDGIRVLPFWMSPALSGVFGYAVEECLGEPLWWSRGLHPDDKDRAQGSIVDLFRDKALTHSYRFRHKDGHYLSIVDRLTVVEEDGRMAYVAGGWSLADA